MGGGAGKAGPCAVGFIVNPPIFFLLHTNTLVHTTAPAPRSLDAIASHGQTVFHDPPHATTQLGDGNVIAQVTGCCVVSDFR